MKNILAITKNTFKETIRDKILYGIIAFALLFLLSTVFFGSISLGEDAKIIKDLGLTGIYVFGLIITIFLGASLVYKEIERKTLYIILSKPVRIEQFVLGKFFGLWTSIIFNIFLMTIVFALMLIFRAGGMDWNILYAILLFVFEIGVFIGLALLFSTITTPLAGTIYSIIILYIGHSMSTLKTFGDKSGGVGEFLIKLIYYVLPNLEKFNIRNSVAQNVVPNSSDIIYPVLYSAIYCAILLSLSVISLKKQDF